MSIRKIGWRSLARAGKTPALRHSDLQLLMVAIIVFIGGYSAVGMRAHSARSAVRSQGCIFSTHVCGTCNDISTFPSVRAFDGVVLGRAFSSNFGISEVSTKKRGGLTSAPFCPCRCLAASSPLCHAFGRHRVSRGNGNAKQVDTADGVLRKGSGGEEPLGHPLRLQGTQSVPPAAGPPLGGLAEI